MICIVSTRMKDGRMVRERVESPSANSMSLQDVMRRFTEKLQPVWSEAESVAMVLIRKGTWPPSPKPDHRVPFCHYSDFCPESGVTGQGG